MSRLIHFVAAGSLALGAFAFTGCEENNNLPPDENSTTAGGNGAFGESPAQPGEYDANRNTPATQPSAKPDSSAPQSDQSNQPEQQSYYDD